MLVAAAARQWKVPRAECEAVSGRVRHKKTGKRLTYGDLCQKASSLPVPKKPLLKPKERFRLIGRPIPRLDIPEKVSGAARFGVDVFSAGMLYAAIARPPGYGKRVVYYDERAAKAVPGVSHVVRINGGVAVCATTLQGAWKARDALNAQWSQGSQPELDNETLTRLYKAHLEKEGIPTGRRGNIQGAMKGAAKRIEATYVLPFLAHATMEPMNCTAHVQKDRCRLWVPTQFQTAAQQVAAKEAGLKPEAVHVHTTYLGGGFGRRTETDVVAEAVRLSKATARPVKVLWSREEDMQNDFYRPASWCRIRGALDEKGRLIGWWHRVVAPSIFARAFPQWVKNGIDPAAVEGIADMNYEIPNRHVEYVRIHLPVPVGFWRSVGHAPNAFVVECFMDELARVSGKDPLAFRLGLLRTQPRSGRVLKLAAEKAGWGKEQQKGHALGIAHHVCFGTYVAQVAEVSVDKENGRIRVHRIVCAVDCGPLVNPDTVAAQMEGAVIMGLSAAMKERVRFSKGRVATSNFDQYDILRMDEVPKIEVHMVPSEADIGGVGEPGLPPVAPAVANAVFAAAGIRIRELPMHPGLEKGGTGPS
jgi:isoquinoline 1-oxidoreductase beta subunit